MKTELRKHNHRRASYDELTITSVGDGFQLRIERTNVKDYQCIPELQQHCTSSEDVGLERDELLAFYSEIGDALGKEGGS